MSRTEYQIQTLLQEQAPPALHATTSSQSTHSSPDTSKSSSPALRRGLVSNTLETNTVISQTSATPSSRSSFSADSPNTNSGVSKKPRKRQRLTLVCDTCKKKKIKCDKQSPCTSCVKSNQADTCCYTTGHTASRSLPYVASAGKPIQLNPVAQEPSSHTKSNLLPTQLRIPLSLHRSLSVSHPTTLPPVNSLTAAISDFAAKPTLHPRPDPISSAMASIFTPTFAPTKLPTLSWKFKQSINLPTIINETTFFPNQLYKPKERGVLNSKSYITPTIGVNPVYETNEQLNFFKNSEQGPFSWSSLMKTDLALVCLWDFVSVQKDVSFDDHISLPNSNPIRVDVKKMALIKYDLDDVPRQKKTPYQCILKKSVLKMKCHKPLLVERILQALPNRKTIWLLIERYFKYLYPFIPIMDEESFIADMTAVIGERSVEDEEKLTLLNIKLKTDFITLGTMMVLLRYTYLTLFKNNDVKNVKALDFVTTNPLIVEWQYLLKSPILIDIIKVASECRDLFEGDAPADGLTLMQLTLMIKLYHRHSPEDGHSAVESCSIFVDDELLKLAYSLGLNRDPDLVTPNENPRVKNLKRKMWHFIVLADMYHSYTFANPSRLENVYHDTKPPVTTAENSNLRNKERDIKSTANFFKIMPYTDSLKQLLQSVLDRQRHFNISALAERLSKFEVLFFKYIGDFENIIRQRYSHDLDFSNFEEHDEAFSLFVINRNFQVKSYLGMVCFLISVYQHFYLFYLEHENYNLAFYYLKKTYCFMSEILPYYFELLVSSETCCDFVYNPVLQSMIHKSIQINLAVIIRLNFILIHQRKVKPVLDEEDREYYTLVNELKDFLMRYSEVLISSISKLSNRYYFSWRITKGHNFFLAIISKEQFYQCVCDMWGEKYGDSLCISRFNILQLRELHSLVSDALSRTITYDFSTESVRDSYDTDFRFNFEKNETGVDQQWLDLFFDINEANKEISLFEIFQDFQSDLNS